MNFQFVSQRQRPVRGSALNLLLDYIRTSPCKTSLTAAGCYLCPAPGTKGTKVVVSCSVESMRPLCIEVTPTYSDDENYHEFPVVPAEVDEIILEGKSHQDHWISHALDAKFLNTDPSDKLLDEAKRMNIISEMTYQRIIEMRNFETERFRSNSISTSSNEYYHHQEGSVNFSPGELFLPGQCCYFMNRFMITWKKPSKKRSNVDDHCLWTEESGEPRHSKFGGGCVVADDVSAQIRPMVDADWLTLAKISKSQDSVEIRGEKISVDSLDVPVINKSSSCSNYAKLSAEQVLKPLKSIPAAARRGLPVLVSPQGALLSIPSIGFKSCPCLIISSEFKPRVPLGGGHCSFL